MAEKGILSDSDHAVEHPTYTQVSTVKLFSILGSLDVCKFLHRIKNLSETGTLWPTFHTSVSVAVGEP